MDDSPPLMIERKSGGRMTKQWFIGYVNPEAILLNDSDNLVYAKLGQ